MAESELSGVSVEYSLGQHEARIETLESRCDIKEAEIKVLNAWKNKAIGYVTVLVMVGTQIIDKVMAIL